MTDETKKPEVPAAAPESKPETAAAPVTPAPATAAAKPAAPAAAKPAAPAAPKPPVHKGPVARVISNALSAAVSTRLGDAEGMPSLAGEAVVKVKKVADLPTALKAAKEAGADYLSDVTSAHYPKESPPFEIIYHLFSLTTQQSLRIKARLEDAEEIPTAVTLWPGADWMEREIFDLMGLKFSGHPDLRRILTPEEWDWSPLRKEFTRFGPDWVNKLRGGEARKRYDERGIHYARKTAPEAFVEEAAPAAAPKPAPAEKPVS
jgi:NADH:ubiquinone oxidoreductase subunit C